ncbi:sugar O-acetyltransferase [Pelagibius marinus]|uniref:sugar O-acetyltransferase n=1 Tax=Pelagibius marinus TaxID=2762760 RepID=UPI001872300D|nr:sugar O-acetyltransferase [Pelagibius marinus]
MNRPDAPATAREKMLAGLPYNIMDPELIELRERARRAVYAYNRSEPMEADPPSEILKGLLGGFGAGAFVEAPFRCAYGVNTYLGEETFLNAGCVILDCARVEIGDKTLIGPAVQIYTAEHPLDPTARAAGTETARPVILGRNVWIGGGAILLPGVTLGENAVIGAGSVVTKDVPADCVAAGNPAKVIRQITEERS